MENKEIVRAKNSSRITRESNHVDRESNFVVWLCDKNYLTKPMRLWLDSHRNYLVLTHEP